MEIGIAADHGGYALKEIILPYLTAEGHTLKDFGAYSLDNYDDYPDLILPLAYAISRQEVEKGIAICGSGVGASIAANKVPGVRAALITDHFSAHQGVEDDDMNIICLGGRITGNSLAMELVHAFIRATFSQAERHLRRLNKIKALESPLNFPEQ